jgi:hypothetical protein
MLTYDDACQVCGHTASDWRDDVRHVHKTLGLKWKQTGSEKPATGTEIKNALLASALQGKKKVDFKKEEWHKFRVTDLSSDSYIKAGNCYFKPAGKKGGGTRKGAASSLAVFIDAPSRTRKGADLEAVSPNAAKLEGADLEGACVNTTTLRSGRGEKYGCDCEIRQHTSAYLSIPQHTSAYLSVAEI